MIDLMFENIGLHHIGVLVVDIEDAAANFRSILGYSVESEIIEDHFQTARVQFFRLPRATSWLELISPIGTGGKLNAAVARGGGLHHICYEVKNLDAACHYFREKRCFMISPPTEARAFPGRRIAWFMDDKRFLFELVETGPSPLSLESLLAISKEQ